MIVYLGQNDLYAPLLPPGAAAATERLLIAARALKPKHLKLFRAPWYRRLLRRMESMFTLPGHFLYLGLRKRFVHDEAVAALEAGASSQLLVVGAGMDTLGLRLAPRFPGVSFVELDHPASQRAKLRSLEATGGAPQNLRFLPHDLASPAPLDETLAACDTWRTGAPSFVVSEGLLMYLPEEAVDRLARAIHRATGPGSRWLLSYMTRRADGLIEMGRVTRLMTLGMKLSREPVLWGIRHEDLPAFLGERGFRVAGPPERYDLQARYLLASGSPELAAEPLGTIEHLRVAERIEGGAPAPA